MSILVTAGQVLAEPELAAPQALGGVLVDGPQIAAVGPASELRQRAPQGTQEWNFPSSTLLPGLINAHVHLGFDASSAPTAAFETSRPDGLEPDAATVARAMMFEHAQQLLAAGVTTARDLGDRDGLAASVRDTISRGGAEGPRLLVAGTPLTSSPNGHCAFLGGGVEDGDDSEAGRESVRAQIEANLSRGADWIKVMGSGGKMSRESPEVWVNQFDDATFHLAVATAHERGLPVAVHAHGVEAIAQAVAAGAETVEHCGWRSGPRALDLRPELAEKMAAHGVVACPTPTPNWHRMAERSGVEFAEAYHARLGWMHRLGVPLVWGTDAGTRGSTFDATARSLSAFVYGGIQPSDVLPLATTAAARALRVSAGALRPGLDADLLVVDGDPSSDIGALERVRLVVARGQFASAPLQAPCSLPPG